MSEVISEVLGLDVGGTTIAAARARTDGTVDAEVVVPTLRAGGTAAVSAILEVISRLRTARTAAVGVVVPGVVSDGTVHYAANLRWRELALQRRLAQECGLPVAVGHDVTAAALAEARTTGDGSCADLLYVSIGTGIAAAHVVDGVVASGATGRAGELGHVPVHPDGERCACGQTGCLEVYASAAAVARRYAARSGRSGTAEDVVHRLTTDPDAVAVWQDAVEALAVALTYEVLVRDPARIVLGGGLSGAGQRLLDPLRAALTRRLAWRPLPPLQLARSGALAGRAGALDLARRRAGEVPDRAAPPPITTGPITTGPITTGPITTGPITTGKGTLP